MLVLVLAQPTGRSLLVGMSIAACGEAIRDLGGGSLRKSREVTVSGPYRWVAHPLYVGSSVMGVGLAIASASVVGRGADRALSGATLTAAIKSEEAFLRRTFGDQYDLYRSGVAAKRRERSAAIAPAVQPRAGDRQPRVPRGRRPGHRDIAADLEGNV